MCAFTNVGFYPSLDSCIIDFLAPLVVGYGLVACSPGSNLKTSTDLPSLQPSTESSSLQIPQLLSYCSSRCGKNHPSVLQDCFRARPLLMAHWGSLCSFTAQQCLGKWNVDPWAWPLTEVLGDYLYCMWWEDMIIAWVRNLSMFTSCIGFRFKYTRKSSFLLQIRLYWRSSVRTHSCGRSELCSIHPRTTARHTYRDLKIFLWKQRPLG